ncbi:acyl carrier protein [Pseudomonas sp. 1176_21]
MATAGRCLAVAVQSLAPALPARAAHSHAHGAIAQPALPSPLPFKDNAMTLVETLQTRISEFICCEMDLPPEDIDLDTPLGAFGLGSLAGMKLIGSLEQQFGLRLSPTLVFEHPTIAELALAIAAIAARGEAAHV